MLFLFVASYDFIDSYKLCVAFSFYHLANVRMRKKSLLKLVYNKTIRHCRLLFLSLSIVSRILFSIRLNYLISICGIFSKRTVHKYLLLSHSFTRFILSTNSNFPCEFSFSFGFLFDHFGNNTPPQNDDD